MNQQSHLHPEFDWQLQGLRDWLISREYHLALNAMDFAGTFYNGVRKDGYSPAFSHPLAVACNVKKVSDCLVYPEESLCAAFLHDVCEDFSVSVDCLEARFGYRVAEAVWILTKKYRGWNKTAIDYYQHIALDPIASVVKTADRG